MASRSTSGHSRAVSSASMTRPSRPHDSAKSRRRCSSRRRSSVSASSRLPIGLRHHRPSSSSDVAFSTVYLAKPCMVFEALVWKMIPGAWLVDPPVLKRRPCSTTVTSDQPRNPSSSASEHPTMPAPMITTRGVLAICVVRPAPGIRMAAGPGTAPPSRWLGPAQEAGIQGFQTASFSATHFSAAAARSMFSLVM